MAVVGGGQVIVEVHQVGEADDMQFAAVFGVVETLGAEVFSLKQPSFRHFDATFAGQQRGSVFNFAHIGRVGVVAELHQPLGLVIMNEHFRPCAAR